MRLPGRLTTKNDSNYTASLDIQAAIGQGNTVVTPVQLATYAATLANRGTRYRTHFVKAILDSNTGEVLQETQPEVMDVIEDRGDTFDLVRQGMIGVSQTMPVPDQNYPVHHRLQDRHPSAQRGVLRRQHLQALHQHHDGGLRPGRGRRRSPSASSWSTAAAAPAPATWWRTSVNAYFAMQDGTLNAGWHHRQAGKTAADSDPR